MKLREYQKNSIIQARESMKRNRAIIVQGATGTGKTPIMAAICEMATIKKSRVWTITPRTELLSQASNHLKKWNVAHGIIDPTHNESRAYRIHTVSKDTLIRRYDKIKNPPDLIMWDECHIALDQQILAYNTFPETKFIGFTATPERGDGRGLSLKAGGIYDDLILGESIPWMMQREFLTPCEYYAPEIEGVDELHKKGTDVDATELNQLFERKKVYGKVIQHYRELGKEKPALVFCRDVKSAYKTADEFTNAGYKFHCIEGNMRKGLRKDLIKALENGEIDGLTNCEIATYGLDVPRVEVGILLRPTFSRALYFQMVGRTLRPYQNNHYKKQFSIIIDHVNNWQEHTSREYPTVLPFDLENIDWNFHGTEKRKRSTKNIEKSLVTCSECWRPTKPLFKCEHCGAELKKRKQQKIEIVDVQLKKIESVKLADLPFEEKREVQDNIADLVEQFEIDNKLGKMNPGAVGEMIALAERLGNNIMWVYHQFTEGNVMVNASLLYEIARQKGYKSGWARHKKESVAIKIENKRKELEACLI